MSLSYHTELTTSYAAIRARLWGKPKQVNIAVIQPKELPAPAREWICQQAAHVWAWKAHRVFDNYCDTTADHGEVRLESGRIFCEDIARACAIHFDISIAEIKSARRQRNVTNARQVAMYLCKILTSRSLPEIGRRMGGRDHTTVLHSTRVIAKRIETDEKFRADISAIRARLEAK